MTRRVVITGRGAMVSLGNDVPSMWRGMCEGRSGVTKVTKFDTSELDVRIGSEVKGFDPVKLFGAKQARRLDPFVQYCLAVTMQAVEESRLKVDESNAERVGVIIGSGKGGTTYLLEQFKVLITHGPKRISPMLIPTWISNMAAGHVAMALGAKGPNFCVMSACSTSAHAIGEASEIIKRDDADVMIAGGTEATLSVLSLAGFGAMKALSTRNDEPERASRPFDRERDGFVMAEGAGSVILEELEHARARHAPIFAEVAGYATTADAYHVTAPPENGEGLARAMRLALRKAGLVPEDVDYINAHGTSTPQGDIAETRAVKSVFGDYAWKLPISSTKSMIGHLLGASGVIEAIACMEAIRYCTIPPTINYEFPDPECDLDYVPNAARQAKVDVAMSNSAGFGGHNVSLILRRYPNGADGVDA